MASLRALVSYASSFVSQIPFLNSDLRNVSPYEALSGAPSCPLDGPVSCQNSTPITGDSCCFVHPNGRILLAQYWDPEVHASGAEEDWTLHGLWPERCDGTHDTYCSDTPQYTNITSILRHYGQTDLLQFINRYWLASSGPNPPLWQAQYNRHATCINTLSPHCYSPANYAPGIEAVDYLTRAATLFRTLDTYRALARARIEPHATRTYARGDVRRALERFAGGRVVLRCEGGDVLRGVGYVFFVRGSLQTGEFVPSQEEELGEGGGCEEVVRYLPKRRRGEL